MQMDVILADRIYAFSGFSRREITDEIDTLQLRGSRPLLEMVWNDRGLPQDLFLCRHSLLHYEECIHVHRVPDTWTAAIASICNCHARSFDRIDPCLIQSDCQDAAMLHDNVASF